MLIRKISDEFNERPSWDNYHMALAKAVATRASCHRKHVGAVVVTADNRILSTGYNGAPSGMPSCLEEGCTLSTYTHDQKEHCVRSIHAEMNALLTAAKYGVQVAGSKVYVTYQPCEFCVRYLTQAGILETIYLESFQA